MQFKLPIAIIIINTLLSIYVLIAAKMAIKNSSVVKVVRVIVILSLLSICLFTGIGVYKILNGTEMLSIYISTAIAIMIATALPYTLLAVTTIPLDIYYLITRKRCRKVRLLLLSISTLFFIYLFAWLATPMTSFQVVEKNIDIANLPESFDGFKIVQISDIHITSLTDSEYKAVDEEMTEIINSLKGDIVVMTGDLIHSIPDELDGKSGFMNKIQSRLGNYFVYGNHDIGMFSNNTELDKINDDIIRLGKIIEENSFKVLDDEVQPIIQNQDTLYLLGVNEKHKGSYLKKYDEVISEIPENGTIISLIHNSHYFALAKNQGRRVADLSLGGHTHAMQIEFDFMGIDWSPSDLLHKYSRGLYKEGDKYLYINRGIGYHAFRRIGTKPEVTLLTLRKKRE